MLEEFEGIILIEQPVLRAEIRALAQRWFGNLVKAVVDIDRNVMAVGGELHADEERLLLERGSKQKDLWGVNLYPDVQDETWIECDSMVNIRPRDGNRSRGIDDPFIKNRVREVVSLLVVDRL